jgi:hypothetical protein
MSPGVDLPYRPFRQRLSTDTWPHEGAEHIFETARNQLAVRPFPICVRAASLRAEKD